MQGDFVLKKQRIHSADKEGNVKPYKTVQTQHPWQQVAACDVD